MSDGMTPQQIPWTWPVDLDALRAAPPGTITFGYVPPTDGWPIGQAHEFHNCDGVVVGGPLDSRWTVQQTDPLTVTPSVWCKPPGGCGLHGFIREGKWVPA